jgi:hypothetical protein
VNRNKLWQILKRRGYPLYLIQVIKSVYLRTIITLDLGHKILEESEINRGVRQGFSLSLSLFNIYRRFSHRMEIRRKF